MGFEYKLKTNLTEKQADEIKILLINSAAFDKSYVFNNKEFLEFRKADNTGNLPNINIILEHDGIYICQYGSSYVWTDLDALKNYIETNKINYDFIDYQD